LSLYALQPSLRAARLLLRRAGSDPYLWQIVMAPETAGRVLFIASAALVWFKRPVAAWVAVLGFVTYLANWVYYIADTVVFQLRYGLFDWALLTTIPRAPWRHLIEPGLCLAALLLAAYFRRAVVSAPIRDG
jgi:hypothetical protein